MIDWNKFKNGKLSVILRTKELAEDFYEKCKKHEVDWGTCNYAIWNDYHKEGIVYEFDVSTNSLVWCHTKHITGDSIEWKGENKMEKTFREVIRDIKEGEVWECTRKDARIKRVRLNGTVDEGLLTFDYGEMITEDKSAIRSADKFKLKRKEYTFEEAFKAYEEGKEIESNIGMRFKKFHKTDKYFVKATGEWVVNLVGFELEEIRNKWYIND